MISTGLENAKINDAANEKNILDICCCQFTSANFHRRVHCFM